MREDRSSDDRLRVPKGHPKLPNEPLSGGYSSVSPSCLSTPSCLPAAPSPPRRVPLGAASKSHDASPWASLGRASSCSPSLRASPGSSAPDVEHGASRSPAGSRRRDRSNYGTGNSVRVRKGELPSGRTSLRDRRTTVSLPRSCTPSKLGARAPARLPILRLTRPDAGREGSFALASPHPPRLL